MLESLTLCATVRLAQTLRAAQPVGLAVWRTPQALTIAQWLAALGDEALLGGIAELPLALDPYAERVLWEQVIGATLNEAAPLFDLPAMAASAAEAHALCRVWNLHPEAAALSEEAKRFIGWQAEFELRCRNAGWLDLAGVQRQIVALLEAGHFALPQRVIFAGFDRFSPFEQRLMAVLTARGAAVEAGQAAGRREYATVMPCADLAAECAAAGAWVKAMLAARPTVRLGIVAPDLAGVRERLAFLLDDLLHPANIRPDGAALPRLFNFSLGRPLAELPLIRAALDLLALGSGRMKVEQGRFSELLLASGWGAAEAEADGRAQLDAALRRDLPYFTTLPALLRLAERLAGSDAAQCPQTLRALSALSEMLAAAGRKRPGEWAGVFRQALTAAGWPGDRALSSDEFQARRAFGEVLDSLGRLDVWLGGVPLHEAVRRLRELCRQRLFQPETRGQPAVQVLGVLESAGLQFDALWVMGMSDDQWPPAPRPNPLLPAELLRAVGASHASAEVELDFAWRVHARLLQSAAEICFSYAQADGNRILRPSPLIAAIPRTGAAPLPVKTLAQCLAEQASLAVEALDDHIAPPVAAGEKVSGGSWLLRAQAICPAWAFYQFRLGAEAMATPVEGLDPAARGTLAHAALEAFWSEVASGHRLAGLGEAALAQAIQDAVAAGLLAFERKQHLALPARFRALEAERLAKLLAVWLAVEAKRDPDFTVIACEQSADVEIEGIKVRMVVDRIDQLDDGRQLIIDYKTGQSIDVKNWAEARITEPQLPIYAALAAEAVSAAAFAKVLLDKPAFAGVADAQEVLPGVAGIGDDKQKIFDPAVFPDWPSVTAHWRDRLHAVAQEVGAGVAGVVFADEKKLRYCDVLPLLRLPERRRLLAATADLKRF